MGFSAKEHLIKLGGKDYLETKWRLVWFREDHPHGSITTDLVNIDPPIVKATVANGDGRILATGMASAVLPANGNAIWKTRIIEKAETAAIGRALAVAGFGTQFSDDDESDHLADSPVERRAQPRTSPTPQQLRDAGNALDEQSAQGNAPEPGTNGNGHAPDLTPLAPAQRRDWFQSKLADKAIRGVMTGTIPTGQQIALNKSLSEYFKNDTQRIDFLNYHFGNETRAIKSAGDLHDKEFNVLKVIWLAQTDPEQIAKEVKLFTEAQKQQAADAAQGGAG